MSKSIRFTHRQQHQTPGASESCKLKLVIMIDSTLEPNKRSLLVLAVTLWHLSTSPMALQHDSYFKAIGATNLPSSVSPARTQNSNFLCSSILSLFRSKPSSLTSELRPIDLAQSVSKIPATPWVVAWFTTLFRSVSALSKASSKNVQLAPFEETSVCLSGRVPLGQEWYCWTNSWKAWFSAMEGLSYHLDQSKIHRFIR